MIGGVGQTIIWMNGRRVGVAEFYIVYARCMAGSPRILRKLQHSIIVFIAVPPLFCVNFSF